MKVLLLNNFHYHRGGAERAYFDVAKLLEKQGHEVAFFAANHEKTKDNHWRKYFVEYFELSDPSAYSLFSKFKIATRMIYKWESRRKLRALLAEFQPDVAHLHNIYHHLTPSVVDELKMQKIPMVMTLHDFQFVCPNNILFANGKIWENSKDGKFYKCVSEKCVSNSYSHSLLGAIETYFHKWKGTIEKVDVLLSPSNFLIDKAREFGFEKDIQKLPNPILRQEEKQKTSFEIGAKSKGLALKNYIAFIGRLSEEKGIDDLLQAFAILHKHRSVQEIFPKLKLVIMGDGPQKNELVALAKELEIFDKVIFIKYDKHGHDVIQAGASVLVSPSRCYENSPYGVLEALSLIKPIVCANLGGQKEIIRDGVEGMLFEPGNIHQMAEKIRKLLVDKKLALQVGQNGRRLVQESYEAKIVYEKLMEVYKAAIQRCQKPGSEILLDIETSKAKT